MKAAPSLHYELQLQPPSSSWAGLIDLLEFLSEEIAFLSILFNTFCLTPYKFAVFCRQKPCCWMPFASICVVVGNLNTFGLKNFCEGEISSQLMKGRRN